MNWTKIKNEITDISDKFIIAVSGGVDSMFLLDFVKKGFDKNNFAVAHFNHKIRDNSDEDENLVRKICEENNIKYFVGYGKNLRDISNQECVAREQRWNFLEHTASSNGYDMVLTAHHLNDYVENYLIGTIRGIDIISCIMPQKHVSNGIIRYKPFLKDFKKEDIIKIAKKRNLQWNDDETNNDVLYLRNRVRNNIIPEMMKSHNVLATIPNVIKSIEKRINSEKKE